MPFVEFKCPTSVPRADGKTSEAVPTGGELWGHTMGTDLLDDAVVTEGGADHRQSSGKFML